MTTDEKLQMATEAINAHGNTQLTEFWYRRWMPERYKKYGLPTTVQFSLSCFLMQHCAEKLREEG